MDSAVITLFKQLKDTYEEQARISRRLDSSKAQPNNRLETRLFDAQGRDITPKKMAAEFGR
jgi:uncharacterized protein YnzC (UPF0291/DUF896 family)